MTFLLSLIPPLAWLLIFFTLLFSVSYLYVKGKNLGKVVFGVFVTFALIGSGTWGYNLSENQELKQTSKNEEPVN